VARQLLVSRTALDTKMSKFVFMRLGPDGVQCKHKGLYWWGYKLSREGADPKSLWRRMSLSSSLVRCVLEQESVSIEVPPDVAPASPFIVPKRRARVTFVVKR
jgi:hypothetical protein